MRFSLSTLLLSTIIIAISIGWYVDRNVYRKTEKFHAICMAVAEGDYTKRLNGVSALREHGGEMALPPLIFALGDPDSRIAFQARDALESLTGESFRAGQTQATDWFEEFKERNNEWGLWIKWYSDKHRYTHKKDRQKGPLLFSVYVQNGLQTFKSQMIREQETLNAR